MALEAETVLDSVTRRRALESAEPAGGEEQADAEDLFTDLLRSLTAEPASGRK